MWILKDQTYEDGKQDLAEKIAEFHIILVL
jgi:hypothetical protein